MIRRRSSRGLIHSTVSIKYLLGSYWTDLQDSGSDLRKEIQYSAIPFIAFLLDAIQFNAATFTLNVPWPTWFEKYIVRWMVKIFGFFEMPVVHVSYHVTYHALGLLIVLSIAPLAIPTQRLLLVLGDVGAQLLFASALLVLTVFMMPCIRFFFRSMTCTNGHPPFLPGVDCYEGVHIYYVIVTPMLLTILLLLSIQWEILTTSPIEMAKMDRIFIMSMRETKFSYQMLIIKVLFVLPLSALETVLSNSAKAAALFVVASAAFFCLLYHRPLYHIDVTAALAIPLLYAISNNAMSLAVLHVGKHAASPLVIGYMSSPFQWRGSGITPSMTSSSDGPFAECSPRPVPSNLRHHRHNQHHHHSRDEERIHEVKLPLSTKDRSPSPGRPSGANFQFTAVSP